MSCYFIVPLVGAGTITDPREPKYVRDLGKPFEQQYIGESSIAYCATVTEAECLAIAQNADAAVIRDTDLDQAPLNLADLRARMEAAGIPAGWINAGMVHRSFLRNLIGTAQVVQRAEGQSGQLFSRGDMALRMDQLPAEKSNAVHASARSFRADSSRAVPSAIVGDALMEMGRQFIAERSVTLGEV